MKDATPVATATWCSYILREWENYSLCLQILHLKDVYEPFCNWSNCNCSSSKSWWQEALINFDSLASYYGFGKHDLGKQEKIRDYAIRLIHFNY